MLHLRACMWSYLVKKLWNDINSSSTNIINHVACYEATEQVVRQRNFIPKIKVVDNISNHLLHYKYTIFYASNNKSNDVVKTIGNMYHVVEDRIQYQGSNAKHV
jgi:hypothetical protein